MRAANDVHVSVGMPNRSEFEWIPTCFLQHFWEQAFYPRPVWIASCLSPSTSLSNSFSLPLISERILYKFYGAIIQWMSLPSLPGGAIPPCQTSFLVDALLPFLPMQHGFVQVAVSSVMVQAFRLHPRSTVVAVEHR